ncbi:FAD/FMN-containing dehydrogenase [Litorivivens lipolytica]|uniref:FAD/FMN-containing dehydrogenase n=1 Tax=Litorivivens lipolytica TaxID=1524264 RepID=A0A7W4W7L0_9GAMM|nr:FAD/FMN-containing dehydrogenase [Litorivivens lipolytica]
MVNRYGNWGGFPASAQSAITPSWRHELGDVFQQLPNGALPYGQGRSYGDSCLADAGTVVSTENLKRFIEADWSTGCIVVEAGMTLSELLMVCLPRGWFLPVTPGTRFVSVGGAVANDVHGKNHHVAGTFGRHVRALELLRSDRGLLRCTAQENERLFAATVGGLGLTGLIVTVELQLIPVASSMMDQRSTRFDHVDEFFDLAEQHDRDFDYSVAWVDCLATGSALGRGHFIAANHSAKGECVAPSEGRLVMPLTPPISPVNRLTLRLFNELYFQRQQKRVVDSMVAVAPFFYPLDGIRHWNRLYGRRGFQQYQCVIPEAVERDVIPAILKAIADSGLGSFLSVLKKCGDIASPGLLSFPMKGTSLALDFPRREQENYRLFARLDAMVSEAGGRLYPAKDSHMQAHNFQEAYPQWVDLEALRDPKLLSAFWRRVALTEKTDIEKNA